MKSSNDCTCASPHVDCWSSRCRHDALKVLQTKCDELFSDLRDALDSRWRNTMYTCGNHGGNGFISDCVVCKAIAKHRGQQQ